MKNLTDISMILDKSGSMQRLKDTTIKSYNSFLEEQQTIPEPAEISLYQFSDDFLTEYEDVDIQKAPKLTDMNYRPGGWTALLDAVGNVINKKGEKYRNLPESERPDKVVIVIITDGEENSSTEYEFDQIKKMIERQRNQYNWKFVFLGAGIDAFSLGSQLGVRRGSTKRYAGTPTGIGNLFASSSKSLSRYRGGESDDINL